MSVATENRCPEEHPRKNLQCVMGKGHAGSHRLGGIDERDATDRWVTKCEGKECVYDDHTVGINAGYAVCLHCGDKFPIAAVTMERLADFAQQRELAWMSMANELRRERNYHIQQHREWKDRYEKDTVDLSRQVEGRDKLLDLISENIGMSPHERFLLDRNTRNLAEERRTLVEERTEVRNAWRDIQQGILDWMARGCPIDKTTTMEYIFGEKLWRAAGILNRVFSIRG